MKLTKYYLLNVTGIEFELLEQQQPLNRTATDGEIGGYTGCILVSLLEIV
jgi:hypothetical protein